MYGWLGHKQNHANTIVDTEYKVTSKDHFHSFILGYMTTICPYKYRYNVCFVFAHVCSFSRLMLDGCSPPPL